MKKSKWKQTVRILFCSRTAFSLLRLVSNSIALSDFPGKTPQSLPQLFASLLPNVSDAPIRLQGKALNHIFESPTEVFQSIQKYYVNETLRQVYRIVGSLDFVGNPTMLFTSVFSGVRDLVMTPSMAFMRSPTDASGVGIGVAKGALSLFSHSSSGFFGFWAKVSAAAGQGLAYLTFDPDYRDWHRDRIVTEAANLNREWKRRGVQNARSMVLRPATDLLLGIAGGALSIIISPIKGYRRGGCPGFARGIASGITGTMVKPLIGVLDAMVHVTSSIHDISKSVNVLDKRRQPALRLRLPYHFGIMFILAPFDEVSSRAVYLLKYFPLKRSRLPSSEYGEVLVHVEVLPNISADTYMIVSNCRVILIRLRRDSSAGSLAPSLCWEVPLNGESKVSSRLSEHGHSGIALTLTASKSSATEFENPAARRMSADLASLDTSGELDDQGDAPVDSGPPSEKAESSAFDFNGQVVGEYHGSTRGEKGELLQWYSVLAEYDYRPQLARLHNAVSCIGRDFEAIIRDPSLGRPASTDGYTSFGMFFFEATDFDSIPRSLEVSHNIITSLGCLPWIDKETFVEAENKPPAEQVHFLARQRDRDFQEELQLARGDGGPDWLAVALAEATFLNANPEEPIETSDDMEEGEGETGSKTGVAGLPKKIRRWAASPLPTIHDGKILETTTEVLQFMNPFRKTDDGSSANDASRADMTTPKSSGRRKKRYTKDATSGTGESSPLDGFEISVPDDDAMTPSLREGESFYTAATSLENSTPFRWSSTTTSGSDSSKPEPKQMIFDDEIDEEADWKRPEFQVSDSLVKSDTMASEKPIKAISEVGSDAPPSDDRLGRMEGLMERLLIFSSERALADAMQAGAPAVAADATPAKGNVPADAGQLYKEIADLRAQLRVQADKDILTDRAVEELREEIAAMKGRALAGHHVTATSSSSSSIGRQHATPDSPPTSKSTENDTLRGRDEEPARPRRDRLGHSEGGETVGGVAGDPKPRRGSRGEEKEEIATEAQEDSYAGMLGEGVRYSTIIEASNEDDDDDDDSTEEDIFVDPSQERQRRRHHQSGALRSRTNFAGGGIVAAPAAPSDDDDDTDVFASAVLEPNQEESWSSGEA